eukprot:s2509_g12.t2
MTPVLRHRLLHHLQHRPSGRPFDAMYPRSQPSWGWDRSVGGQWGYAPMQVMQETPGSCGWNSFGPSAPAIWHTNEQQGLHLQATMHRYPQGGERYGGETAACQIPGLTREAMVGMPMSREAIPGQHSEWQSGGTGTALLSRPSPLHARDGPAGPAGPFPGGKGGFSGRASAERPKDEQAGVGASSLPRQQAFHRKMRNIQLNKELLGCDSPEKILKICDESLDEFNQVNVVTALHRIAKHHNKGTSGWETWSPDDWKRSDYCPEWAWAEEEASHAKGAEERRREIMAAANEWRNRKASAKGSKSSPKGKGEAKGKAESKGKAPVKGKGDSKGKADAKGKADGRGKGDSKGGKSKGVKGGQSKGAQWWH